MKHISEVLQRIAGKLQAVDEELPPTDVAPEGDQPVEEKDEETILQEHVKNNIDKYKKSFEELFPTTQMAVKNIEYRGMLLKDKIRVIVDLEATLLNFDALQILSNKEIGLVASGENTFRVYNIYLPRIKDTTVKMSCSSSDKKD